MIEIDGFLEPVAGANPCGENLYYSPVFDKIREARRQDDAGPMGQWERELKASDFRTVVKLGEEALRTKTKDLWLAAWLAEAWIGRDRIPGLAYSPPTLYSLGMHIPSTERRRSDRRSETSICGGTRRSPA